MNKPEYTIPAETMAQLLEVLEARMFYSTENDMDNDHEVIDMKRALENLITDQDSR